jgi:hypothetical protein
MPVRPDEASERAAEEAPPGRRAGPPPTPPLRPSFRNHYLPARDFENAPGELARYQVELELLSGTPVGPDDELFGRMSLERTRYEFGSGNNGFDPSVTEPFERIDGYVLELGWRRQLSEQWSAQLRVQGELAAASGAHFSDGFSVGASVDFAYASSPSLLWIFGLGAQSRLEEDPLPYPRLGFLYRDQDWSAALYGPNLRIMRRLGESTWLGLTGNFEFQDARLSGSAAVPHGVLRDRLITLGPALSWRPLRNLELRAEAGWSVYHQMQLDGRYGEPGPELDLEGGLSFGLQLEWSPVAPRASRSRPARGI